MEVFGLFLLSDWKKETRHATEFPLATFPLKIRESVSEPVGACGKYSPGGPTLVGLQTGKRPIQKSVQG